MFIVTQQPISGWSYSPSYSIPTFDMLPAFLAMQPESKDSESSTTVKNNAHATKHAPKEKPEERVVYRSQHANVVEEKDKYLLSFDLPGVKKQNLNVELDNGFIRVQAERKSGNTTTAKFSQHFAIDEKIVDPNKLKADLEDGVLTITIGKKDAARPFDVHVVANDPPAIEKDSEGLYLTLDLPGVKLEDLKVKFHCGDIEISGERKRKLHGPSKIHKVVAVKESAIDTKKLQGYLMDGVLTIVAPANPLPPTKKILLTNDDASSASKQSENMEDTVVVETADDEE